MRRITAEEFELLSFFEVEPKLASDDPWPYADALYEVSQGALTLSVSIHPAYRDVRVVLKHDGKIVYEMNAMGVADVRYGKDDQAVEELEIALTDQDSVTLRNCQLGMLQRLNDAVAVWQRFR